MAAQKGLLTVRRAGFQPALDPNLPRWVLGDPGRLKQLVSHLLSNAIKFTSRNGRSRGDGGLGLAISACLAQLRGVAARKPSLSGNNPAAG